MQVLIFGAIASLLNYKCEAETQEIKTFGNGVENIIRYSGISLGCYLSFLFWSLLPTHCRCRGLLLYLATLNDTHTYTHTRWASSGRVIGPSQRPLSDNTQHSQETTIHTPGGIGTGNPSKRAAANLRLRPREHQHQQNVISIHNISGRWCESDTPDLYPRGALFDSQWKRYTDWGFCGYFNPSR
jgi:hypothetical protein